MRIDHDDKWEEKVRTISFVHTQDEYAELLMLGSKKMSQRLRLIYFIFSGAMLLGAVPAYFVFDYLSWFFIGVGLYIALIGWLTKSLAKAMVKPFLKGDINRSIYVRRYHEISNFGLKTVCDDGAMFEVPWSSVVESQIDDDYALFLYSRYHGVCVPRRALPSNEDWSRMRTFAAGNTENE